MERVIVDMDEVIADPMGAMISWYRSEYSNEINFKRMLGGSWIKGFPEEHQEMLLERLHAPGFFRHLPVMAGSVEVLREMNRKYELFIVSAAMEFPHSLKDKYDWLLDHFPFISWRQLVLCGSKSVIQGDYMIDDHVKNLKHFQGKKYMYTAAHNLDITDYERLNNWEEVAEVFLT